MPFGSCSSTTVSVTGVFHLREMPCWRQDTVNTDNEGEQGAFLMTRGQGLESDQIPIFVFSRALLLL